MIPNSYSLKEIHTLSCMKTYPDSKVHGANMGPTWVLSAPDGPHVGPMNLAISVSPQLSWLLYNPPFQQPLTQVYWHYNTYLQLSFFPSRRHPVCLCVSHTNCSGEAHWQVVVRNEVFSSDDPRGVTARKTKPPEINDSWGTVYW